MAKSVVDANGGAIGMRESSAVSALIVAEHDREVARIAIPCPEVQLIVRFGPTACNGMDVHAFGVQQTVHRKQIASGRAITARLRFGTSQAVLGVPSFALTGKILALEELWGETVTQRFSEELIAARSTMEAADIVERTIAERFRLHPRRDTANIVRAAAALLENADVKTVSAELGVSERHLRRVFREAVGVGPKAFAKLMRFDRALRAGREVRRGNWAGIAVAAGYYDQAHLIDDFRSIAGVTPRTLLGELSAI